jgi:hypothetical protein
MIHPPHAKGNRAICKEKGGLIGTSPPYSFSIQSFYA